MTRLAEVWRMKQWTTPVRGPGAETLSRSTKSVTSRVRSWSPRPRVETVTVCDWGSIGAAGSFDVERSEMQVGAHVVLIAVGERLRGGLHLGAGLLRHLDA